MADIVNADLHSLGWQLTQTLGANGVAWKTEDDSEMEVWAGERYFVVTCPEPGWFYVSEEDEKDHSVLKDFKPWRSWEDAAGDLLDRIKGPR